MDNAPTHKFENEVEKLKTFLQLSERRRLNQKLLYDKNLENLHEKLADFERTLLKEQKQVQARLQSKDQQIRVQVRLSWTPSCCFSKLVWFYQTLVWYHFFFKFGQIWSGFWPKSLIFKILTYIIFSYLFKNVVCMNWECKLEIDP